MLNTASEDDIKSHGICSKCLHKAHQGACDMKSKPFLCTEHNMNYKICKCPYLLSKPVSVQNSSVNNFFGPVAFDMEVITLVGPNGKEVSALITYDSFASQSSIASSLVSSMNLSKKNLGKVKIQTYAGIIEDDGHTASVRIKELNNECFEFLNNQNSQTLGVCLYKIPLAWKKKYRK